MSDFTLHCGNCLDMLADIKSSSIGLVFADPPYNVGKDYGVYKDNLSPREYARTMSRVIKEARRVSAGKITYYVGSKLIRLYFNLIPDAHLIIVHKRAIGIMEGNYFLQYHGLFSTVKPNKKTKDLWDDIRLPGEGYFYREEREDHPGQTSAILTKRILDVFSKPGDTILDPYCGTGTTGVVCMETNRNFVGIDINPDYIARAEERISIAKKQLILGI